MMFIPMIREHPVLVQEWEAGRKERFRAVTLWMFGLMDDTGVAVRRSGFRIS